MTDLTYLVSLVYDPTMTLPIPLVQRVDDAFQITATMIDEARERNDLLAMAQVLHGIVKVRTDDSTRLDRARQLFQGLSIRRVNELRATYLQRYNLDPELTLANERGGLKTELLSVLNAGQLLQDTAALALLVQRAESGTLTHADRHEYFALLPRLGQWNAPRAAPDRHPLDSVERTLVTRTFRARVTGHDFDDALCLIEAGLPKLDLRVLPPRSRSVAAVVSSQGLHWQALMDWAMTMIDQGYGVQLFTPDGRPAAVTRDSLLVSAQGGLLGCPPSLDPRGRTGELAKQLFAKTLGVWAFDPRLFGAVYLCAGAGVYDDFAFANLDRHADGTWHTRLIANQHLVELLNTVIAARMPLIAVGQSTTLFTTVEIELAGRREPLNRNLETASLPPLEGTSGPNTHQLLTETGGRTNVLKDIDDLGRVVRDQKDGLTVVTGSSPLAAIALAEATIDVLRGTLH